MDITITLLVIAIVLLLYVSYMFYTSGSSGKKSTVYLFYKPTCGHCRRLKAEAWPTFTNSYGTEYVIEYDLTDPNTVIPDHVMNSMGGKLPPYVPAIMKIINGNALFLNSSTRDANSILQWAYNNNQI